MFAFCLFSFTFFPCDHNYLFILYNILSGCSEFVVSFTLVWIFSFLSKLSSATWLTKRIFIFSLQVTALLLNICELYGWLNSFIAPMLKFWSDLCKVVCIFCFTLIMFTFFYTHCHYIDCLHV